MAANNIRIRFDIDLKVDQAAINVMFQSPRGLVGEYIYRMGMMTWREAVQRAPVKTGALKSSIGMTRGVAGVANAVEITANISYALAVHEGVGSRTIRPNRASVLRFPDKAGMIVYAPKVTQGPRAANPFLWEALQSAVAAMA